MTRGLEVGGRAGLDMGTALGVDVGVNVGVNVDVDVGLGEDVEVGTARALVILRGPKKASEEYMATTTRTMANPQRANSIRSP